MTTRANETPSRKVVAQVKTTSKSSNVSELSPSFKDSSVLPGPGKCPEYDTGANESIFQWNPSA